MGRYTLSFVKGISTKLFDNNLNSFQDATIEIYRKKKTVFFLCLDLIWKPIGEKVRFVLVIDGEEIFMPIRMLHNVQEERDLL